MRLYDEATLAAALGITTQAVNKRATNGRRDRAGKVTEAPWAVHGTETRGKHKVKLYAFDALPKDVRAAIDATEAKAALKDAAAQRLVLTAAMYPAVAEKLGISAVDVESTAMVAAAPAPVAVKPAKTANVAVHRGQKRKAKAAADLDDKGRRYQDAALLLCVAMDAYHAEMGVSQKKAALWMAQQICSAQAAPHLIEAERAANPKPRQNTSDEQRVNAMSLRLYRMLPFYREGRAEGDSGKYLVAGKREKEGANPLDVRAFLIHFCLTSRPTVSQAWKEAAAWYVETGLPRPAVDTFYRIEKALPVTIKYRGRMTGGEWKALLPYVARDVSMFHANDIWVGDGHSFKAKVQHPIHGQPFTPELTVIIDWVSRRVVGWSVDMAESTIAVSAAFRHAQIQTRARALVYYSDNGSGQTGKPIDCPIHGTLARQGIAHQTGIPGNAQGRGIIERLWQVTAIPLARTYPTCTWRGADKEATRKMLAGLNKKDGTPERLLPTFAEFMADCERVLGWEGEYNTQHSHRELGGLTPAEAYAARLDPDSVFYAAAQDADIDAMWLPEVARTPQRGVISLFGNEYARGDLPGLLAESEKVRVRFDIHNADRVWLYRMDGRPLGAADWDAHKRAAFPVPYIEQKRAERVESKVKSLEKKAAVSRAELGNVIEGEFSETLIPARDVIDIPRSEKPVPLRSAREVMAEMDAEAAKKNPKAAEKPAREMTWEETKMWLYGGGKDLREEDEPPEEAAAR